MRQGICCLLGLLCFLMMSACAAPTEELPEEETATAEMPPELAERFPELPVVIFQEDFPTYI